MAKIGRPGKITKEQFLIAFREGRSVSSIFRTAGLKSKNTYYYWMKSDKEFKAAVHAIMGAQGRRDSTGKKIVPIGAPRDEGWVTAATQSNRWQDIFMRELERTRDRVLAADRAKQDLSFVLRCLDSSDSNYDHEFAKRYEEYRLRVAVAIEDETHKKAISGGSESMQKYLLPTLPFVGDKYKKAEKNKQPEIKIYGMIFGSSREEAYNKTKGIVESARILEN